MLRLSCVLCIVLAAAVSSAQKRPGDASSAHEVGFCDLVHHPKKYDGQWIVVRGRVSLQFEDFSLYEPSCDHSGHPGVWLTFGGDQDEIATFCCGEIRREKGTNLRVRDQEIPLTRDDTLAEFQRLLQTRRLRRPDGKRCEADECDFYRKVDATVTGFFLAGSEKGMAGYGHLGCCHLLVITRVNDVSADRTDVPAGGEFVCSQESWKVSPSEAAELNNALDCAESEGDGCASDRRSAFVQIAKHWNDKIDINTGTVDQGLKEENGDSSQGWDSADLLTSYIATGIATGNSKSNPPRMIVTRHVCKPVSPELAPQPASAVIACKDQHIGTDDNDTIRKKVSALIDQHQFDAVDALRADAAKNILGDGDQSWRLAEDPTNPAWHALKAQTARWGVAPNSGLRLEKCESVSLEDQAAKIVSCNWTAPDAMQEFSVTLEKYPKATKTDPTGRTVSWAVISIGATVCSAASR